MWWTSVAGLALIVGCFGGDEQGTTATETDHLTAELAEVFREDISTIDLSYDFWPNRERIAGSAVVSFEMRPGQSRPVFHFNPLRESDQPEREMLRSLSLDGEQLDPADDADLRRIRPAATAEPAFEIQRDVDPSEDHTIDVTWSMPKPVPPYGDRDFFPNFDDTEGPDDETETLWPTVSSPDELARHRIELRVHSGDRYAVIGSGRVEAGGSSDGVQVWNLDTEVEVSSSNVFFAAMPEGRTRTASFDVDGVEVTILSNQARSTIERARSVVRRTIPELVDELGPFPTPRMQILLTDWGSGMEYYGATRTGLGSLRHELGHMYFATTAVNRTWRDTWLDEALVVWWEEQGSLPPAPAAARTGLADRSAVSPGFNEAAYGIGARIMERIARALGGPEAMRSFLADLHVRRAFEPFTTEDFIDDVVAAQDEITREQLERWLGAR